MREWRWPAPPAIAPVRPCICGCRACSSACVAQRSALPCFDASIVLWRSLGARDELCNDLGELALAVGHLGDIARARELWAEELLLAYEIGEAWQVALYLEGHAELALMDDRADLAARLLGAAATWRSKYAAPVIGYYTSITQAFASARERLAGARQG